MTATVVKAKAGSARNSARKKAVSQDNDRRNTNRQRGRVRAMSVLGNAKSKSHRKTHQVKADGMESKMFMHLTRGDFRWERGGEVSRGPSSEESRGNTEGAKGRRTKREPTANHPAGSRREDRRNNPGVAIAATTWLVERESKVESFKGAWPMAVESKPPRKEA